MKNHMTLIFMFFTFLCQALSIKFYYILGSHQVQCFHESSQAGTRYQIEIKANLSEYYLHVNEDRLAHQDSRPQFYKYYSAFANSNVGITFCIGNLHVDQNIELQVQFYHGFYLQNSVKIEGQNEFIDLGRRVSEMSDMIQMNYGKYKKQLLQRQASNQYITAMSSFMVVLFLIMIAIVKLIYFNRIVKYMKYRKII